MQASVKLFYGKDGTNVMPVTRVVNIRNNIICETIQLLIQGKLRDEEVQDGFHTEFPHPDFKLKACHLKNGILTLTFTEIFGFTNGGASRVILQERT